MRAAILALVLVLLAGCTGSHWLRPHAFVPPLRHYRIRYSDLEHRAVLPAGWTLLNHTQAGLRRGPEWSVRARPPTGGGPVDVPLFDVYAENARDGSTIAVQTIPQESRYGGRSLDVLAHQMVSEGLGEGFIAVGAERGSHRETQVISSQIVEEHETQVSGVPAYFVTVQLSIVGSARMAGAVLLTFVMFRPVLLWRPSGIAGENGASMMVVASLEATRDHYDAHRAVFDAMLDRLDVRRE